MISITNGQEKKIQKSKHPHWRCKKLIVRSDEKTGRSELIGITERSELGEPGFDALRKGPCEGGKKMVERRRCRTALSEPF